MEKNQEKIGIVTAMGFGGEGIIKDEGQVVFVPFAIVGEKVKFKVLKVTKKCVYAKLLEVLEPSSERIDPICPVFKKCGGCAFLHINCRKQLEIKSDNIKNCFKKISNLDVKIEDTICGKNQFRYRNKIQLPVGFDGMNTIIGFYAENSHRIISIDDCYINPEWTKDVIKAFKIFIDTFNIKGYNSENNSGELREITVKEINGNLIITAVILGNKLRNAQDLIEILKANLKNNFSLFININNSTSNVIYGDNFSLLYGEKEYFSSMLDIQYPIGVRSFMQVNSDVCYKLYNEVKNQANISTNSVVIDAYSGAGLMTAILAKTAKKVVGIEIIPEAVECANTLAKVNGLDDKITNYLGKCEDILPDIIGKLTKETSDLCLVLDPPRKGCDIKVINSVIKSGVKKIIYVSCLPSSLARDVGLIVGSLKEVNGEIVKAESFEPRYSIKMVKPFDMFSNTKHIETLVVLEMN